MVGPGAARRQRKRAPICPGPILDGMIVSILSSSGSAMSAYELLDHLKARQALRNPMSVYRSLERLCALAIVQKVEATSGYRIHDRANAVLLTCTLCVTTTSVAADELCLMLVSDAERVGFRVSRLVLEAVGACRACAHVRPSPHAAGHPRRADAGEEDQRHRPHDQPRESAAWQNGGMI